jgi:hypothetical protein
MVGDEAQHPLDPPRVVERVEDGKARQCRREQQQGALAREETAGKEHVQAKGHDLVRHAGEGEERHAGTGHFRNGKNGESHKAVQVAAPRFGRMPELQQPFHAAHLHKPVGELFVAQALGQKGTHRRQQRHVVYAREEWVVA